jgi:hypothetical protein
LARQEGGFATCFPLDVLIVYSPKLTFIAHDNNLTSGCLSLGETIFFSSLELTTKWARNAS